MKAIVSQPPETSPPDSHKKITTKQQAQHKQSKKEPYTNRPLDCEI